MNSQNFSAFGQLAVVIVIIFISILVGIAVGVMTFEGWKDLLFPNVYGAVAVLYDRPACGMVLHEETHCR